MSQGSPPPAPYAPAGYAAAEGVPHRKPVWPLIGGIALILALIVGATAIWRRQSMAATGKQNLNGGTMVAVAPRPNVGGDLAAVPQTRLPGTPITPAPSANPAPVTPVPVGREPDARMPPEVLAYLRWLAQLDTDRYTLESAAEAETVNLLPQLMTGGLGTDLDSVEQSPLASISQTYQQWTQRLVGLQQRFNTTHPPIPQQCLLLHSLYGQALEAQAGASRQIARAMAAKQMDGVTRAMAGSRNTQAILMKANAEFGAVCGIYRVPQFYEIKVVQGSASLPSVLPH